ncbi:MAG: short-chain dehydrogenase/reductase [Gammaproteobacteria bacterium]|nr:MAG: short-chain dehydrogenase/reductase [Gammaproteobacteria bacterium]
MRNLTSQLIVVTLLLSSFVIIGGSTLVAEEKVNQKAVLVTGASTGIGRMITENLAAKGYFVYAGARKEKDLKSLNLIKNVQSVRLDVTRQDEIDAAVDLITKAGRGLDGLVNNAGVAIFSALIEAEQSEMDFLFNVNVFGVVNVTKAFSPLIIKSKGRITTIGSTSGIGSGQFFGPYSMTKHAVEAYTDSLAIEMAKFDVKVSVVEPGNYDSKIVESLLKHMKSKSINFDKSLYKEEYLKLIEGYGADRSQFKSPEEVAASVEDALFSEKPKRRYLTVPNQGEAEWVITTMLRELAQLNAGHEYTYSREELIKMLDEQLESVKK